LHELERIIAKEAVASKGRAINYVDTSWIDFDKFAELLGLSKDRLTQGTWEKMGIVQDPKIKYGIRRCPECWRYGFHTALFDIGSISTCPIHKCELTDQCVACTLHSTFDFSGKAELADSRLCIRCRCNFGNRADYYKSFADVSNALIDYHCRSLLEWWAKVGFVEKDRDIFLGSLLQIGSTTRMRSEYRSWQFHYACSIADNSCLDWQFSITPETALVYIMQSETTVDKLVERESGSKEICIQDDEALQYRSLRRHLFRRYIKPHRRCYQKLLELTDDDCLSIDFEKVCLCSLAFVIWRMTVEGLRRVEGLRIRRQKNFGINLMHPHAYSVMTLRDRLLWSYFSFLGIWRKLDSFRGVRNVRVERSDDYGDGTFFWVEVSANPGETRCASAERRIRVIVLYPDVSAEIEDAHFECSSRSPRAESVVDKKWYSLQDPIFLDLTQQKISFRQVLFQLKHPGNSYVNDRFCYLRL